MKSIFTLIFFTPIVSFAQGKSDTAIYIPCPCSYSRTIEYPKRAIENNICGTVILEIEVDTFGIQSNPKVLQGLGYGCDESALKTVRIDIANRNECRRRCGLVKQKPEKLTQAVTFECADKE